MVARITYPGSLLNALNYHEQKVKKGKAEGLHAENFLLEINQLNFYDKLERFKNLMELNTRAETKLLHVSLNFDPSEKLSIEELTQISTTYMDKIGFGNQPYLVYRHEDAGHPHIHILTTTIREDGGHINTHNIGRTKSSEARVAIEKEFGLVVAAGRNNRQIFGIEPVDVQKCVYGKSETKRSIINVLDAVINHYNYTSLAELNAVLKSLNVIVDRGKEGGRIYQTKGLVYHLLDKDGNRAGVPVKASSIYSKPTLTFLENKFTENELERDRFRKNLRNIIEPIVARSMGLQELIRELRKEKIETVLRRNDKGLIYGITFIDHKSKSVFNGSDLGKQFSAAAIQTKLSGQEVKENRITKEGTVKAKPQISGDPNNKATSTAKTPLQARDTPGEQKTIETGRGKDQSALADMAQQLLQPEKAANYIPFELRKKKKKKKSKLGL